MPEELGKIEKPPVDSFMGGRKLFFIPLIFSIEDMPEEFTRICTRYWEQVDTQVSGLEVKLGTAKHIFHELVAIGGAEGLKALEKLGIKSLDLIKNQIDKGSSLDATEDPDILAELMDWSRCLSTGLQSRKVFDLVHGCYIEAGKRREDAVLKNINETLKGGEIGLLILTEGQNIQFPNDVQIFYVAPPALDEIKRWLRDYEAKFKSEQASSNPTEESE